MESINVFALNLYCINSTSYGNVENISQRILNLYIGKFANFDNADIEEDKTTETEPYKNPKKTKNIIINWGLPIGGAVLGYYVGKKMEAEPKKLVGYVIFFTLIGFLPRYLYKN
jgi:hypothetical protein